MTLKYKDIIEAKELLELPDRASMEEIKSNYRRLIGRYHPDRCRDNDEECSETAKRIIAAYNNITLYCNQYKYSFAEEELKKHLSDEEWWFERFGVDPLWGKKCK